MRFRKKSETPHEKLMRHSAPVNRAAARALFKAGADDSYFPGLRSQPGEIESETFIKFYRLDEYLTLFSPSDARHRFSTTVDQTGNRVGRMKVMGFYLPDFPDDIEPTERYKLYEAKSPTCQACGQALPKKSWGPKDEVTPRPKLRWVCKCACGNYVVRNSTTVSKARDPNDSCSACRHLRKMQEGGA